MAELRTIARHAGTLLAGQLAVMAFGVTDTIVAGRHAADSLAALSVGSAVYISVFVATMGTLQALLPAWAELHGKAVTGPVAQRSAAARELGWSVRQSLYLALLAMVLGVVALLFPGAALEATEVPQALQGEVRRYLGVLALALPPALLMRMWGTLNQSLGRPQLVTWLQVGSLLLKVPLTVWFAFGGLGLPAGGAVGCAWATVLVNWIFCGAAFWLLRTQAIYRPYAVWQRLEPPDWGAIGRFARLGVPAGLSILVEVTSFTLMALFIARQGTVATAAHQVAANLAAVLYMTPLSIAIAASARVSFWLGAGDPARARHAMRTGFALGAALALLQAAVVLSLRGQLAAVYSPQPQVVGMATGLLAWLALYHLGDAAQALCVFMLRCYRVTVAPLVAYCVLLWGGGLAGGFALAYHGLGPIAPLQSPAAFWIASSTALGLLAFILPAILWHAVHRWQPRP